MDKEPLKAVEMEAESGHRFWKTMPESEVEKYIEKMTKLGYYLSDIDDVTIENKG